MSALVAFVPRFLFSSSDISDAGVYLFGGCVSLDSFSVFFIVALFCSSSFGSTASFSLTYGSYK